MAKIVFALIFTLIVSAPIPSPVFAAPKPRSKSIPVTTGGFSLTPTIGGYFFSGSDQRDTTPSYGLKIGYDNIGGSIAESLGIEGSLNYFSTKSKTDASDDTGYLFRLDAIYPFILGGKWMPFLAVGAGGIVIDSVSHPDKSPLLNYGAGVKYFLEDYLAVRVDARHLLVYNNVNIHNNYEVSLGLSYYFGKERKKKPERLPDSDQDGVPDKLDKCPNTPRGLKVDKDGCLTDSDKDGVPDNLDKCPDTLPGISVDMKGCPEEIDKKNTTPAETAPQISPQVSESSAAVTATTPGENTKTAIITGVEQPDAIKGSPSPSPVPATVEIPAKTEESVHQAVGKNIVRELTVEFKINSSYINPVYSKKLMELADIIKNSSDASASIEGHTDSTGKLTYNSSLSIERAQNIRSHLIKLGVDPDRISTIGFGSSRPIADNTTIKGRKKNRRAITVLNLKVYT
jgi:OOP family OmpA-OmpF porin